MRRQIQTLLGSVSLIATVTAAYAQTAAPPAAAEPAPITAQDAEAIVVIGSQIKRVQPAGMLPVVVMDSDSIEATAATSGDDLLRSIPQAGDVGFNESRDSGGINDARGDTASVNLRALGTGNTLVLLNGRRMVLHPGTQTENLVPVQSVNANAIPVLGVERVEVLLDGAAALYGSDAVAGVINTVLKTDFEGFVVSGETSVTDNSDQMEHRLAFQAGHTFNDGRTNLSFFGSFLHRDPLYARERAQSRSRDLRPFFEGTEWEGDTDFDNRTSDTMWGEFARLTNSYNRSTTTARVDGRALTTNGVFHIQPDTNDGCVVAAGPGTCFDNSTLATLGSDNNLRYDTNTERTIMGEVDRLNLFAFLNHEFNGDIEFYGEAGYYRSDYNALYETETALANQRLIVPANGYWNPFGPVGSPNRIEGLTGVSSNGVPLELLDYRPIDVGPQRVNVVNETTRFLGGLRGTLAGFDWDSAVLYSRARTNDTMRTISATLFQEALARTDETAYNPFDGGDPLDPSRRDSTPNPTSVTEAMLVDVSRISTTSLTMADFKLSRPDLLDLPAGGLGMAAGVEYRHETFKDDRDDRLDGTIVFTALDGSVHGSDVLGASPTPDTEGARDVFSAFLEFAVPVVSPEMDIPGVHSIDLQLAGRYEHYDTFGGVAKPKVALSYHPVRWLQLRGAWSQGFRAPNLPQQFEQGIQRSNSRTDWILCEADLRAGRISNFEECARGRSTVSNRSGSLELEPEKSDNTTLGITIQPPLPSGWGRLTLTADWWQIKQKQVIGLFGDSNALILDYLLRLQGSHNPLVERVDPTPEDIADFEGTGLAPVGDVIQVIDNYTNLSPRTVRGLDFGFYYQFRTKDIGNFSLRVNAARLLKFHQEPGELQQVLLDAQAKGILAPSITITGAESLIEQNGRPKWRGTATLTWRLGNWGAGYYGRYVGKVEDTSASMVDGTRLRVGSHLTHNLYGQYTFDRKGSLGGLRVRLGVRNLTNNMPPIADQSYGYIGDLYSARGRVFYASFQKRF